MSMHPRKSAPAATATPNRAARTKTSLGISLAEHIDLGIGAKREIATDNKVETVNGLGPARKRIIGTMRQHAAFDKRVAGHR